MIPGVRRARAVDLAPLVELLGSLFDQEAEFRPDPPTQRRGLMALLDDPDHCRVVVVELQGRVVGMVAIQLTVSTALGAPAAILEDLVVDPRHRGQGVGSSLLAGAIEQAEALGCKRITLLVDADNASAQRLYEGHGFRRSTMVAMRRLQ